MSKHAAPIDALSYPWTIGKPFKLVLGGQTVVPIEVNTGWERGDWWLVAWLHAESLPPADFEAVKKAIIAAPKYAGLREKLEAMRSDLSNSLARQFHCGNTASPKYWTEHGKEEALREVLAFLDKPGEKSATGVQEQPGPLKSAWSSTAETDRCADVLDVLAVDAAELDMTAVSDLLCNVRDGLRLGLGPAETLAHLRREHELAVEPGCLADTITDADLAFERGEDRP